MSEGLTLILLELGVDGDVGRAARIERLDERSPVVGIGDDLVIVAAIEQHVPLGCLIRKNPTGIWTLPLAPFWMMDLSRFSAPELNT